MVISLAAAIFTARGNIGGHLNRIELAKCGDSSEGAIGRCDSADMARSQRDATRCNAGRRVPYVGTSGTDPAAGSARPLRPGTSGSPVAAIHNGTAKLFSVEPKRPFYAEERFRSAVACLSPASGFRIDYRVLPYLIGEAARPSG